MKFSKRFERYKVPAWTPFYVSYKMLKDFLSPFKYMKKDLHLCNPYNQGTLNIHNFTRKDKEKLLYFVKLFEEMIVTDVDKIVMFYAFKVNKAIEKWRKVRINLLIYKQKEAYFPKRIKEEHWSQLKYSFEGLIKRVKLVNEFLALNLEAFEKALKKQIQYVSPFFPEMSFKYRFEKYLIETKVFKMRDLVMNFLSSLENEYLDYFHDYRSKGVREIRKIESGTLLSKNGAFMFGVFAGCTVLLVIALTLMAWSGSTNLGNQEFLDVAFPIYRMLAIIFIYIWLLGFNIFGWTAYHVNYKYLFGFKHHHSELWKVLLVGAVFTTILLISLIWYFLIEDQIGKLGTALDFLPKEVPALIVIGLFLGYLLFPHRRWLNGRGRRHILYLVGLILKTPFIPITFTIIWVTDQLTAFAQPLKDLEYTICFYTGYLTASSWRNTECKSNKRVSRSLIMALIPNVLRMLQCLRQAYDARERRYMPLINFGKYFVSSLVTVMSYLIVLFDAQIIWIILWFILIGIGAVYNFIWDVKCDWGLLRPNSRYRFLRDVLSYKNPYFYYLAIMIDIFLRAVALMSLSSPVISPIMEPALFQFLIALITIFHRCIWNFFRVENEHLQNLKGYHVVLHLKLPYKKGKFEDKSDEEQWNQDLRAILFEGSQLKLKGLKHNHFANQSCMVDMMQHSKPGCEDENTSSDDDDEEKVSKHTKSGDNALYALKKICDRPFETIKNLNRKKVEKLTAKIDCYRKIDFKVAIYHHIWKTQISEFKKYLYNKVLAIAMAPFECPTGALQKPNTNQLPEKLEARQGAQDQDNLNTNAATNIEEIPNIETPFTIKERIQLEKERQVDKEEANHVQIDINKSPKEKDQLPCLAAGSWTDQIEPGTQREDQGYGIVCNVIHHDHSDDEDDE